VADAVSETTEVSVEPGAAAPDPVARAARIRNNLLAIGLILVVCFSAVWLHVSENRHLGPLDEQAHLDYINRLLDGRLPELGQKLNRETREQVACRGLETPVGWGDHPNCNRYRTNKMLPEDANGFEAGQPPLYYGVTAIVSRVMPGDDIDSIRRVGGFWLGFAAVGMFLTLRRFGVRQLFAGALSVAIALSPSILMAASSVSNDLAVFTFGAFALWAVVGFMKRTSIGYPHLLIGGLIGIIGGLIKPSALLVVGALALAIILQQWWTGRLKWGLLFGASMVLGVLVATGGWGLVVTSLQQKPIDHVQPWARYRVSSLGIGQVLRAPLFNLVAPLKAFIPVAWRNDWLLIDLLQVAVYVQIGVLVLPFFNRWPKDESRSVGVAYLVAIAISGPYYVILYYVATNILFSSDTRFAYGLIPMFAIALALWVPYQWQRWTLTAIIALPGLWYLLLMSGIASPSPWR
jgi:hypothetical protein